jgi:transposase
MRASVPTIRPCTPCRGIGKALALTIALESGDIARFADAGHFASYARTVDSRRESNGKKTGNAKCGNRYLAWAFIEAAHFAVRYDETIPALVPEEVRQEPAGGSCRGPGD